MKELKGRMQALGVSLAGLVEKSELVARLQGHLSGNISENISHNSAKTADQSARPARRSRGGQTDEGVAAEIGRVEKILSKNLTGNFREILGLGGTFSAADLSGVTKKLYRAVHPDKCPASLKDRAATIFDAIRKAETEAQRVLDKRSKVRPGPVAELKFVADKDHKVVTVQWRMPEEGIQIAARPDRFELSAGTASLRVEQGSAPNTSGEGGWYEFSMSTVSRKGNDVLFNSGAFYFHVTPVNEAGAGPERKLLVSLKRESQQTLPSFSGLTGGFLRRNNTAGF